VIQYVEEGECVGADIYSSKTAAWIYKESEWNQGTDVTCLRSTSVFFNGFLHIMGYSVLDMEVNTWRRIRRPSGAQPSIHQAQGHLCVCTLGGLNMS
jgi:hypothetical protein